MLHSNPNVKLKDLVIILNELPPSINVSDKELRRSQTKKAQAILDQGNIEGISDEDLKNINRELAIKNYLLTKNKHGGELVIIDRIRAFETTYSDRFKYFLQNSNDKAQCIQSLFEFTKELCQLDVLIELINKGINFIDIGAGDGSVALPIAKLLNKNEKAKYIAVERDGKFLPILEDKFKKEMIAHVTYPKDFRTILDTLSTEKSSIALVSHLYTTTRITEFLPMVFNLLNENGIIIMAHDTANSDSAKFRSMFKNLLQFGNRDHTEEINTSFRQSELNSITTVYESSLKFPELAESEWNKLYHIRQADYDNDYSLNSNEFLTTKNLIDFVISDRLEAFSDLERKEILDKFREYLIENNYQFKSTCKIQVALSPKHTLECEKQFLQLKDKIECSNTKIQTPLSLSYSGTLFNEPITITQAQQEKPNIGFGFTG